MIQKIYLILFICILIYSCGKKSDPKYKEQKSEIYKNKLTVIL